jgi:peroxiredoxin
MKFSPFIKTLILIFVSIVILFAIIRFGAGSFLPSIVGEEPADSALAVQNQELIGQRAPYFDLPNMSGNHVRLSDYADRPLVIVFWSTWNADAADQIKIIDDYLLHSSGKDLVEIVAIDSQEERSIVSSFMRRGGYQVVTLLDVAGIATETYLITNLPTFYFLDRSGTVQESYSGLLNEKMIVDKIERIIR